MEETVMDMIPGTIAPEKILRDLANMWTELSRDASGEGEGALRACSLTLVTFADEGEDFSAIGETIAALMPEHPARTIVVRLEGEDGRRLSERVYSQCWRPFGQKRQVCCEQVDISATDAALADLPSVILPLAVADLPVVVWCRSARLATMPQFAAIAAMARRAIVDGERFVHLALAGGASETAAPRIALNRIATLATKETAVADLAWTRLTRWRAMLSQVFENRQHLAELPRLSKVTVRTSDVALLCGLYFGAWVMDILSDAGIHPEFHIERAAEGRDGSLRGIELAAPDWSVDLSRRDQRLVATVGGLAQCNPLPPANDYSLMEEELRITGRDAVYERTLASARRIAGAQK
jgi:glucose-6-phosphate dehydrogenase assembly protein OpcA